MLSSEVLSAVMPEAWWSRDKATRTARPEALRPALLQQPFRQRGPRAQATTDSPASPREAERGETLRGQRTMTDGLSTSLETWAFYQISGWRRLTLWRTQRQDRRESTLSPLLPWTGQQRTEATLARSNPGQTASLRLSYPIPEGRDYATCVPRQPPQDLASKKQ